MTLYENLDNLIVKEKDLLWFNRKNSCFYQVKWKPYLRQSLKHIEKQFIS